ncbi:AAA family ATPase [Propioniciclava coleopterorum]|uniref:AAA family ATPase n=1 Tax=Propioniciclava coleopterorum TaxID=2714937 RepID=A0A6G7Y789_9ACTN|nr:AAA family ATPase [Propioniciclava coleopterorum]QIK72682.1 AAA family ATPase [Propioniciclava coleopterorum]
MGRKLVETDRPVRAVEARRGAEWDARVWPYNIPAVGRLLESGLELSQATILVGENGSGKSTILEAVAEAYGFNPEGGSTGARFSTAATESPLAEALQLVRGAGAARGGYFLRAETMHGLFSYLDATGGDPFHRLSHGESFRAILDSRTRTGRGVVRPGLYVLDEPESALSFTSSLHALATLVELLKHRNVQVLMATHSPIFAALPGAAIWQLGQHGMEATTWEDLDLVVNERYFLADPERFLRHLRE